MFSFLTGREKERRSLMSSEQETTLRFSLEESIWFQKGKEIDELISISLQPNITIQEYDQYVTIEGSLNLTGEYKRYEDGEVNIEEEPSPKFIQSIDEREDGTLEFSHRFPVDITIPLNRVSSLDNIDVQVDYFDYALPEKSCMKLTADLTITGLKKEEREEVSIVTAKEVLNELEIAAREEKEEALSEEDLEPIEVEARKNQGEEESEKQNIYGKETIIEEVPIFEFKPSVQLEEIELETIPSSNDRSSQSVENNIEDESDEIHLKNLDKDEEQLTADSDLLLEESSESSQPSEEKPKKKKKSKKQGISIAEFLARKDEVRESVTKLKVCIVQNGETIDQLAERYNLSAQQILRVNHLEVNQDVYEGQVLYIPLKSPSHK